MTSKCAHEESTPRSAMRDSSARRTSLGAGCCGIPLEILRVRMVVFQLTSNLNDRRRGRAPAATVALHFSQTLRLPSVAGGSPPAPWLRIRLPFSRPIKPLARHVKIIRPSLTARKPHGNYVVHTPANPPGLVGRVGPKLQPGLAILSPSSPWRQRLPVAAMRPRQLVGHEVFLVACMNRQCRFRRRSIGALDVGS